MTNHAQMMQLLQQLYGQGAYADEYAQMCIDDAHEQCAPDDIDPPEDLG